MTTTAKLKIGTVLYGSVNNYPPAQWKLATVRQNCPVLANVKHPLQSRAYPDQQVTWAQVHRLEVAESTL